MAKKSTPKKTDIPGEDKELIEVMDHYQAWTADMDQRRTRKNGWDQITDAYYGKLPSDWPFASKTVDPRIRTSLLEKNARLLNSKLRGRLTPRKGGTVLGANLNNALIDFQWDTANDGGSMQTKLSIADMDTRLYGSKFGLVTWRYVEDEDGNVLFDGNEFKPLDIRDCGIDFAATHIRDAKWFQHRQWVFIEDLEKESDISGVPAFKNIGKIKAMMLENQKKGVKTPKSSKRENKYISRIKQLKGLEDRLGKDMAFPVLEIVTEYREDKWITFAPEYNEKLRVIDNPYDHHKIPVAQLRYYPLQDDPFGESEVEAVIPLWKAIQATVCGYLDEVMLKQRPPLKILEGEARMETIVYAPEAQWLMNRADAVTEMQSNGEAIRYFQTTYSALVSAFTTAMGDLSQGTSGVDPFTPDKTATEVRATMSQQNARDQKNQSDLAEFIKDIVSMWQANNKQFLFSREDKQQYLLRIVGEDQFAYFKKAGLDGMEITDEGMKVIRDIVEQRGGEVSDTEMQALIDAAKQPKYPVALNPEEKDPEKLKIVPKMEMSKTGDRADIRLVPEDLEGSYDYIADVKSMAVGASEELSRARSIAMTRFLDPNVVNMLQLEGFKPKLKELLSTDLEMTGLKDADRFFEKIDNGQNPNNQINQTPGGTEPNLQVGGLSAIPQANTGGGSPQQVARPSGLQNGGGVSQSVR